MGAATTAAAAKNKFQIFIKVNLCGLCLAPWITNQKHIHAAIYRTDQYREVDLVICGYSLKLNRPHFEGPFIQS